MAKKQQMSYKEMADYVKNCGYHMTRWDVVSWLIGRQGVVTAKDWGIILRMYTKDLVS